ncbi:MAG: cytochrome c oxidase assembly protein [Methylobacteriaceae bacterium]|nr:cytochrome c oxidase assembly protein [Methylobacteriaceae bacterium]
MRPAKEKTYRRRHRRVALIFSGLVACMVGLSFAAVPLYRLFCAATGYGGTTQVAHAAPGEPGKRVLTVRFDANVAPGLPWQFAPETPSVALRTGETKTVFYRVTNNADYPVAATAAYNVSPDQAGGYFDKLACFCFSEQTLNAHETAEWPVVFFLDPALEQDETMRHVGSVTLSYTFFASKNSPAKVSGKVLEKSADNRTRPGT